MDRQGIRTRRGYLRSGANEVGLTEGASASECGENREEEAMPLTAEEKAGGARIAYINTPQTDRVFRHMVRVDRAFRALNVAFIRGNVTLEKMHEVEERFAAALAALKDVAVEAGKVWERGRPEGRANIRPAP